MKLYANARGEITRIIANGAVEHYGAPEDWEPANYLELDPETNTVVVEALNNDYGSHRLINGVLYRNGKPVTINETGEAWRERSLAVQARQVLAEYLSNSSPTGAQTVQAVKALILAVSFLWRQSGT